MTSANAEYPLFDYALLDFIPTDEAAAMCSRSTGWVRAKAIAGAFGARTIDGRLYVRRSSAMCFMRAGAGRAQPKTRAAHTHIRPTHLRLVVDNTRAQHFSEA